MPDGTRRDGPGYDEDFYAWTQYQAEVLRAMPCDDNRFDRNNVAEEIEDLGKSDRRAAHRQIRRIIEHFLKLEHSPASGPRPDWMSSIANARVELEELLTPTLSRDAEAELPRLYAQAADVAAVGLIKYGEAHAAADFPASCPYNLDQILTRGWYPDPPGGEKA